MSNLRIEGDGNKPAEGNFMPELSNTELIRSRSTTINRLMGPIEEESPFMKLGDAPIHTFTYSNPDKQAIEIFSLVNYHIFSHRVLWLLNKSAPVKGDFYKLDGPHGTGVSYDVGADWAYMVSGATQNERLRIRLEEKVHSPANVPGFKEFIPHAADWIGALSDFDVMTRYSINVPTKPLIPVIHYRIHTDGSIDWEDEPFDTTKLPLELQNNKVFQDLIELERFIPDRFAGMAVAAYTSPDSSSGWKKEIMGQKNGNCTNASFDLAKQA